MHLGDSITNYDGGNISTRGRRALNDAGIFYWYQAKDALAKGLLHEIDGVGDKTVRAIREARPDA